MNQILYSGNKFNTQQIAIALLVLLIFCVIFLSTIFSILNINNVKIIDGVKIQNVSVGNLTKSEALSKLKKELYFNTSSSNVEIAVNGVKHTIAVNTLGMTPDYEKMIENAHKVGRQSNFFGDNFEIQKTYLFGTIVPIEITVNDDEYNKAIQVLRSNINETLVDDIYTVSDDTITIYKGKDGVALNYDDLKQQIIQMFVSNKFSTLTAKIDVKTAKQVNLDYLHGQVTILPANASTKVENDIVTFVEQVDGKTFDLAAAKELMKNSTDSVVKIPLIVTKPTVTGDAIADNMFKDVLIEYSTTYKESEVNRTTNVKLATKKVNGVILMPGQEFSYNKIVGERTSANGFKMATVYANNQLEQGLGGGICQVSSTLYNIVLLTNLEVVERDNHAFTVHYVPLGRDATVVYGHIDFRFKNNRSSPVKLEAIAENGKLSMKLYGTKSADDVEVTIKSVTNSTIKYPTKRVDDPNLAVGKTLKVQNGAHGYNVSVYKIVKKDGVEISNTFLYTDTYKALQEIVNVGTKGATPVNPDPVVPVNPDPVIPVTPDPIDTTLPPGWDVPENPYL